MSLWFLIGAGIALPIATVLFGLWVEHRIRLLERKAGCPEDDPHDEAHGNVVNPPVGRGPRTKPQGPPSSWRGK